MRNKIENSPEFLSLSDEGMNKMLNKMGGSGTPEEQVKRLELARSQQEDYRAAQNLRENVKIVEAINIAQEDVNTVIELQPDAEGMTVQELLKILEDQSLPSLYTVYNTKEMSVVVPAFDTGKFFDVVEQLMDYGVIKNSDTLTQVLGCFAKSKGEIDERVRIGKEWHREYQNGIRARADEINKDLGLD